MNTYLVINCTSIFVPLSAITVMMLIIITVIITYIYLIQDSLYTDVIYLVQYQIRPDFLANFYICQKQSFWERTREGSAKEHGNGRERKRGR